MSEAEAEYEVIPELELLLEAKENRDEVARRQAATIRAYHERGVSYRKIADAMGLTKNKVLRLVAQST